jgi:hypothetical protein
VEHEVAALDKTNEKENYLLSVIHRAKGSGRKSAEAAV